MTAITHCKDCRWEKNNYCKNVQDIYKTIREILTVWKLTGKEKDMILTVSYLKALDNIISRVNHGEPKEADDADKKV